MPNFQNSTQTKGRMIYRAMDKLARPLSILLKLIFYILVGVAAVTLVCMLILAPVRVDVEDMILSPYLRSETGENGNTVYHVNYQDGVEVVVPEDRVTPAAAKTALYAGFVQLCVTCLILAPICRFVSVLLGNLAKGKYGDRRNPDMICFSALTLLVGSPVSSALSGLFRYLLQKAFAGQSMLVKYSFRPDWFGVGAALLLLAAGFVYGCENTRLSAGLPVPMEEEDR